MDCPICGRETSENAKSCPNCGTKFKTLAVSLQPKREKKPFSFRKLLPMTVIILVVLLLSVLIGLTDSLAHKPPTADYPVVPYPSTTSVPITTSPDIAGPYETTGPYIPPVNYYSCLHSIQCGNIDGKAVIIYDTTTVSHSIDAGYFSNQTSLDGSTAAVLFENGVLAAVKNGKCVAFANDVVDYTISVDGSHVAYTVGSVSKSLFVYSVQSEITHTIGSFPGLTTQDFRISPNGEHIAVVVNATDTNKELWLYNLQGIGKQLNPSFQETLLAVSNDGKLVYSMSYIGINPSALYLDDHNGTRLCIATQVRLPIRLNASHSEVLYKTMGSKYTYLKVGTEATRLVTHYSVTPLLPENTSYLTNTYFYTLPLESFFNHTYITNNDPAKKTIYYFYKTPAGGFRTQQLVDHCDHYVLNSRGDRLYYLLDGELLLCNVTAQSDDPISLAKDLQWEYFGIFDNYTYFCFQNDVLQLRSLRDSSVRTLPDFRLGPYTLSLSVCFAKDGALLYVSDGALYSSVEGKIADNVKYILRQPDGTVLVYTGFTFCVLSENELIPVERIW